MASYKGWATSSFHCVYENGIWQKVQRPPNIMPVASGLQYAQTIIEGLKARKNSLGEIILFRVNDYYARLKTSSRALGIPCVDLNFFLDGIHQLAKCNASWTIPIASDRLYIRPIVYGLDGDIFPEKSGRYGFSIYVAPVGDFAIKPCTVSLFGEITRTSKNGLSYAKSARTYSPIISKRKHEDNVIHLWFDPLTTIVEEADTSNVFFVLQRSIITPKLNNRILPGITRDSILEILKSETSYEILEKDITTKELAKAVEQKEIKACFLTSTGIGIQACDKFKLNNKIYDINDNNLVVKNLICRFNNILSGYENKYSHWIKTI